MFSTETLDSLLVAKQSGMPGGGDGYRRNNFSLSKSISKINQKPVKIENYL